MATDAQLDAAVRRVLGELLLEGDPYTSLPLVDPVTKLPPAPTVDAIRGPLEEAVTDLDETVGNHTSDLASLDTLVTTGRLAEDALSTTIAGEIETQTPPIIEQVLAANPEVIADAAEGAAALAQADAGLARAEASEELADNEHGIAVGDGPYLLKWSSEDGKLLSSVGLESVKDSGGEATFTELGDTQGWGLAIYTSEDRVIFGIRDNGRLYPEHLNADAATLDPVVLNGDSMIGNWSANSATLSTALDGRGLVFRGDGGKQSPWIAGRQGGRPLLLTVTGNALPATGSVAGTLAFPPLQASITSGLDMVTGTYIGIVEGRQVSIAITAADGTCTVTITDSINRITPIPAGAPFKTGLDTQNHWSIIWAGRNNFYATGDEQQIVNDIRGMLAHTNRPDRALVLSIVPQLGETIGSETSNRRIARNARLAQEFPDQFEYVDARLRSTDLITAVGLTPTAQDSADIANGYTPESFRSDSLHLNAKGYEALALLIKEIYEQKGWQ